MGEGIGALFKELGPSGIAGLIGGGLKGIGSVVKAVTAPDPNEQRTHTLTPDQSGVAAQLAQQFGLSGQGQAFSGQPGLGNNLLSRVQRVQAQQQALMPPNTNRFGLGGR